MTPYLQEEAMGNVALWFIGIMLGIIVVHLVHIKLYLRDIHMGLELVYDRMGDSPAFVEPTAIESDVTE
ncbi:MAG TPA: hypothetical protein VF889_07915 [Bacteroidota bacterium]